MVSDYELMLKDINVSKKQMNLITNSDNLIETVSTFYKKQKSNIHGIGVFASKNLIKDEFIGIAGLNNLFKTTLGRWINHSNKNNARFFFTKNLDVLVFATKNIKINTEIVANYRDHILNPKIINIKPNERK